jgi:hypothetical protein
MGNNKNFEEKWIKSFAHNISKGDKKNLLLGCGNYLWHACSFNKIKYLEGDAAREMFDKKDKVNSLEFIYDKSRKIGLNTMPTKNKNTQITAKEIDLQDVAEFYIIGENYSWCYIRTHEVLCGPYFIETNK